MWKAPNGGSLGQLTWGWGGGKDGGDVGVIGHPEGARCSWHGEDDDVEEDEK